MALSLPSFPITSTEDADEAQSILSRELSDLRFEFVRNSHAFRFNMNGVRLGHSLIGSNRFATETKVNAGVIEDAVIVSFCVGPPSIVELDGEPVAHNQLAIISPSRKLTVHRSPGSEVLLMRVDCDTLKDRIRELTDEVPKDPILFDRSASLESGPGAYIGRLLTRIAQDIESDPTIVSNRLLQVGLDQMVLNAILALPNNYTSRIQSDGPVTVSQRLVRRAEEFIEAHATEAISISEVLAVCNCSRSALFAAFRRHRGYTPMQFLSDFRFRLAREALSNPTIGDSVSSIARECGFLHLGRFASAYRQRFGEAPAETLRRT